MTQLTIELDGMTCASCVARVERVLRAQPGIQSAAVNLATESASIQYETPAAPLEISQVLARAGYPARENVVEISVSGMTCASCIARVERVLKLAPGVLNATANLATESATIHYLGNVTSADDLAKRVSKAGYQAEMRETVDRVGKEDRQAQQARTLARDTLLALALTLPVFVAEMGGHLWPAIHHAIAGSIGMQTSWIIQFVLITLVLAVPGRRFFAKGVPLLLRGAPDMNSLVVVGTSAAWVYSTVATFVPHLLPATSRAVYFEAAGVIITLILLGRWLENRAKGRTGQAIRHLLALSPKTALRLENGQPVAVPLAEIQLGDVLLVHPGAVIPTDGVVLKGHAYVDESMISGEPIPVAKTIGDRLVGGAVNGTGALEMQASAVGADTVLAQIVRLVEQAQGSKLPVQALVDQIAAVFVPVVMGLALLTVFVWLIFGPGLGEALVAGVAVLIIACPCAMGLATPTSIMVGTGRGAQLGVLFARGAALQTLRETQILAVDKTGTLTEGRPSLQDFVVSEGMNEASVLASIAAVETRSEHPIAQAIVAEAAVRELTLPALDAFESIAGFGVIAQIGGDEIAVGADRLMARQGVNLGPLATLGAQFASAGKTPLYAAINGKAAAVLAVADAIKLTTPAAIAALHQLGLRVVMITGDNAATARHIAAQLGIDDVRAEVLPEGKVAALRELMADGAKLAFVGDGINDAPALASADTGIAIGTGTQVAIESADIVLMSGDLMGVVQAISLSRAVMRNISQNLFWAFGYNALLIPVAAGVLYPWFGLLLSPALAAGAMALSSVFVLSNALRLQRFKPVATV